MLNGVPRQLKASVRLGAIFGTVYQELANRLWEKCTSVFRKVVHFSQKTLRFWPISVHFLTTSDNFMSNSPLHGDHFHKCAKSTTKKLERFSRKAILFSRKQIPVFAKTGHPLAKMVWPECQKWCHHELIWRPHRHQNSTTSRFPAR